MENQKPEKIQNEFGRKVVNENGLRRKAIVVAIVAALVLGAFVVVTNMPRPSTSADAQTVTEVTTKVFEVNNSTTYTTVSTITSQLPNTNTTIGEVVVQEVIPAINATTETLVDTVNGSVTSTYTTIIGTSYQTDNNTTCTMTAGFVC